jgi:uncharacterized protein YndB with AHSA1/START domain
MSANKNLTTVTAEPGKQEVFITREFDAPRELVFKAHTDPELYIQWLGPYGYEMKLETFEPHSGGRYRYIHKDQDGNEYGFHGVFHEIYDAAREITRRQDPDHDSIRLSIRCRPRWHDSIRDGARPQ